MSRIDIIHFSCSCFFDSRKRKSENRRNVFDSHKKEKKNCGAARRIFCSLPPLAYTPRPAFVRGTNEGSFYFLFLYSHIFPASVCCWCGNALQNSDTAANTRNVTQSSPHAFIYSFTCIIGDIILAVFQFRFDAAAGVGVHTASGPLQCTLERDVFQYFLHAFIYNCTYLINGIISMRSHVFEPLLTADTRICYIRDTATYTLLFFPSFPHSCFPSFISPSLPSNSFTLHFYFALFFSLFLLPFLPSTIPFLPSFLSLLFLPSFIDPNYLSVL